MFGYGPFWALGGILFALYVGPWMDRKLRQRFQRPDLPDELCRVEPIICEGCENVFYVRYGSDEFLPDYCCYCGSELFFDSVESHAN